MRPSQWTELDGRVALVTGGCRGIGAMVASGFTAAGARVYLTSRTADECEATAERLRSTGGDCIALPGDVSTPDGIERIAEAVQAQEPELHILVNNAGVVRHGRIDEFAFEDWDDVVDTNLRAAFFVTQALLPLLRAGTRDDRHVAVINMSSITATKTGSQRDYPYRASKAGLNQLTRMLGKDLGGENITVNAIAPGFFRSAMTEFVLEDEERYGRFAARNPIPREGKPEEIAALAVYLAGSAGGYVTGAVFDIDGGLRFVD